MGSRCDGLIVSQLCFETHIRRTNICCTRSLRLTGEGFLSLATDDDKSEYSKDDDRQEMEFSKGTDAR